MFELTDWLVMHEFREAELSNVLSSIRRGALRVPHQWTNFIPKPGVKSSGLTCAGAEAAFQEQIHPALELVLGLRIELSEIALLIVADQPGFVPYTRDRGADAAPEIVIRDPVSPADLLCFAHEVAHAAQLLLSRGRFMPPVAREVCAFLGEIALIERARTHEPDLFPALLAAWLQDDERYCGADLAALSEALSDPHASYEYRMNYPVARAAAAALFENATPTRLRELFAAGDTAMAHLPLDLIARASALPPIPAGSPDATASNAYRILGIVALLDLAAENEHAQAPIGEAYENILAHLRTDTLHIGCDEVRRPVGYACWHKMPPADAEITRRVAPFDPERLQRSLDARLAARQAAAPAFA